jgi:serine/threonine protein kinase
MRFLGKYESLGVLGRGAMGTVHAARPDQNRADTVVVKVMRGNLVDTPRARQFFDREVQYTARLRHPFIVRVLDAGVDPQAGPCIVMEFVPGTTLERLIEQHGRQPVDRVVWLAGCLCHALEAAHLAAVIHRDLKPANLMVVNAGTREEHLKVMDFGLAHLASKPYLSKEQFAGSEYIVAQGTPAYISPEQLRGDDVDGRADLYSAGVLLYEALAGRLPFADDTIDAVVEAHLHRPPPRFAEIGIRDIPAAVEEVIHRCLAKFPAERPASARALAVEIGRAVGSDLWKLTTPLGEVQEEGRVPLAEVVPPEPIGDANTVVRKAEAWMPDRIAIIKLGGFLEDMGGELVNTQPGLLQARFAPRGVAKPTGILDRLMGRTVPVGDGIELDLNLNKPDPTQSRLVVTAVFRVLGGGAAKDPAPWRARCQHIFEEMKKYLMAGG